MEKMITITPTFQSTGPVPPHLFIDREKQISQAITAFSRRENIIVHGARKTGKTSFLHKIDSIVHEQGGRTLNVWFDLQAYPEAQLVDFLRFLCLELTLTAWKKLFDGNFSELSETVKKPPSVFEGIDKKRKSLINFYRLLKNTTTKVGMKKQSDIGATLGLSAMHSETQDIETQPAPLEASELLFSLNDFIKTTLSDFDRIFVLTDEATLLPRILGIDALNRYLELLSDHMFQFIFAGIPTFEKSFLDLSVLCSRTLQLGCFDGVENVIELIHLTLDDFDKDDSKNHFIPSGYKRHKVKVTFTDDTPAQIFELAKGQPWKIQHLCNESVNHAVSKQKRIVEIDDVANAATKLLPLWQQLGHLFE